MGGPPAFEHVYREHVRFVWRTVRRLGVREPDVEDVSQRVFEIVHRQLPEFRGDARLTTWLFGIIRRVVSDHRRSAYERRRDMHEDGELASEPRQEHVVAEREARALLDQLLDELDEDKRIVFVLCELDGMAVKDVSELIDAPVQTVYSRLAAARERLERGVKRLAGGER
ncbi:MAG TPA: sigma-70 family RNA polymerase sigma factor [Kofleriaceae bacterium]